MIGIPPSGGLPSALYDADSSRALDRVVSERLALNDTVLMDRAADIAFKVLRRRYPGTRRVLILAGPGHNGGDGSRLAIRAQAVMRVQLIDVASAGPVAVANALPDCDVVVDALFGTGLNRAPSGVWREAIVALNQARKRVLALDVPSGVDAGTGFVPGVAVVADATVSFISLKVGLFTGDALDYRGALFFDDLGAPSVAYEHVKPVALRMRDPQDVTQPQRRRNTHKGEVGRVLVAGGGLGMAGAARLAGEAAYCGGAGLVTVVTHPAHAAFLNVVVPELIVYGGDDLSGFARNGITLVIGPGLGQDPWAQRLWAQAAVFPGPQVVDGGALRLLAQQPVRRDDVVLTPHPGEAAALLGCSVAQIQQDRRAAAVRIVARYGGICILKGAGTIVADAKTQYVCDCGGPELATAGSGDVLAGLVAALLARGLLPLDAARLAAVVHGRAGEDAATTGMRASDLMTGIRRHLAGRP